MKKFATLLLVVLTTLFVVLGCGSSMGVKVLRNGTADVVLTVSKEKVADIASDLESFEDYFNGYIKSIQAQGKDTDILKVRRCTETDTDYKVTIRTRRINKIEGLGTIRYGDTQSFCTVNTKYLESIENEYNEFIYPSLLRAYPDGSTFTHKMDKNNQPLNWLKIEAKSVESGQIVSFEDFKNTLLSTDKNNILYFQLVDFEWVDEITINLPGKVKYVSVMTDLETETELDTISVDGTSVTLKATELEFNSGTQNAFFGYFVYDQGISPWAIAGIIAGVLGLGALLYVGIAKDGFRRFFKSNVWIRMVRYKALYLLILPAFVLLILFRYMPMVWLSAGFMEYDLLEGLGSEWVGLKYFEGVFYATNTPEMYQIFRNTIFISLIRILSNLPVILFLAILINSIKTKKLKTAFQTISFIPYFLSWVSVGGIFNALLDPNMGLINRLFGMTTNWYGDPDPWWLILSVSSLWKGMGWSTLIYISAMCNIDNELYEACSLDGGGMMRQVFTVTLPGIMNIICLQLILDVSNIMRDNYEQILAMTNNQVTGAIQETVDVVGRISFTALSKGNFGSATAIGLIQGVIGSILVLITNKIVKKTENEGII